MTGSGKIEIDGATFFAALIHEDGEFFHAFEVLDERRVARAGFGVAFENRVDFGVGHARGRADYAFDDFEAFNAAGRIKLHDATEDQAVFMGAKAADVGGEFLRQHGDGAIGKVDAVAAQTGFQIEGGVGLDVFGHVGDVDLELVAAVGAIGDENGVIEVAGGFAVDGDDGQAAEIGAAGDYHLGRDARLMRASARTFSGKTRGKLVLANHHLHVDAKVIGRSPSISMTRPMGDAWAWANW